MSFWRHRARSSTGLPPTLALVLITSAVSGCSKDDPPPPDQTPTPPGSAEVTGLRPVGTNLRAPLDGAPSPDGSQIYFIARQEDGSGALFQIAATGGDARVVAAELSAPVQLAVSLDGTAVYVADLGAGDEEAGGVVLRIDVSSGNRTVVDAATGYRARGLDVIEEGGAEVVYLSGNDPRTGAPGVFRLLAGRTLEAVPSGDALHDPSGIAAAADGTVFVADPAQGAVLAIRAGQASSLLEGVALGYPAGIALSHDERFLLVSALDPLTKSATVYRIEIASGVAARFDDGLSASSESAGLHRARNADRYAWADADDPVTGRSGTVFMVGTKASPLP